MQIVITAILYSAPSK